jgi:hypothetical protein
MSKTTATAAIPRVIQATNLSLAWARVIDHIQSNAGTTITPLVMSTSGFDTDGMPIEDVALRLAIDALLAREQKCSVETVAFTIFPERLWSMAGGNRHKLFADYRLALPRYKAMNRKLNGRGLYFERLMMFDDGPYGNQLEHIISTCSKRDGVRDSLLQASIFDPTRDHSTTAQLGFPCLQHITFVPTSDGLVTNAFYATQQLFVRAYGNYLGLAQLCSFMARELDLPPARLNVYVGVAKLERIAKTDPALTAMIDAALHRRAAA